MVTYKNDHSKNRNFILDFIAAYGEGKREKAMSSTKLVIKSGESLDDAFTISEKPDGYVSNKILIEVLINIITIDILINIKDQPKLNWRTLAKRSMNFSV
jgi:hypothetical protein